MTRAIAGLLVTLAGTGAVARSQPDAEATGVRGGVVNHEATPLTEGAVTLQASVGSAVVSGQLDQSGRFRLVPTVAGRHRLRIVVPGYAPRLADVIVPSSRAMALPTLLLEEPAYFRAKFVTSDGEVIVSPAIRRRTVGPDGVTFPTGDGSRVDADGSITIGPLADGVTSMALDMPGLAQTRLPDVTVRGDQRLHDGGTIVIQPGTVVHVAIVNLDGTPVADYPVTIEDAQPNSPLTLRTARTDSQGRATFDRLGAGRYRVSSSMLERCSGREPLSTGQQVTVNGTGNVGVRIVVGGRTALSVTSSQVPLAGRAVSVAPASSEHPTHARTITVAGKPPIVFAPPSCPGSTDGDGRATFAGVPGGAARVSVRLHNSTFERRVDLRGDGRDIAIEVPAGALQLRVINRSSGLPVPQASVTWNGGGYRVLATATGSGDVLLEGVGDSPGAIEVTAPGFLDAKAEVPGLAAPLEVAMTPAPSRDRRVVIVADTGEPIAHAIVLLAPATVFDVGVYATPDANGVVRFLNLPPGAARVAAQADGFVGAAVNLPADSDAPVTLTLVRRKP